MINIVLVDDNPGDQLLFKEAMKETQLDYQLRTASSAKESLTLLEAERPDVIFMDLIMPGWTGGDFVKILNKQSSLSDIPVIFLTGVVDESPDAAISRKLNVGGTYFPALGKPVDAKRLRQLITELKIH